MATAALFTCRRLRARQTAATMSSRRRRRSLRRFPMLAPAGRVFQTNSHPLTRFERHPKMLNRRSPRSPTNAGGSTSLFSPSWASSRCRRRWFGIRCFMCGIDAVRSTVSRRRSRLACRASKTGAGGTDPASRLPTTIPPIVRAPGDSYNETFSGDARSAKSRGKPLRACQKKSD